MSKLWLPFAFVALVLCTLQQAWAQPNNIATNSITSPAANERRVVGIPIVVTGTATNVGSNAQSAVKVYATISQEDYGIVYRDTVTVPNWLNNVQLTLTFRTFMPFARGEYTACLVADLPSDQQRSNDTLCQMFFGVYDTDLRADSITYPGLDDTIRAHSEFRVRGTFENIGLADQFDVKARVQLRRCVDDKLYFQADTTIEELYVDSLPRELTFPSRQESYDIRTLDAGCYRIAIIANHPVEADRTNDTVFRTITLYPNFNNVRADAPVTPLANAYVTSVQTLPVSVQFKNIGLNEQDNVMLTVSVRHSGGNFVMRDSAIFNDWIANETRIAVFDSFTTLLRGMYTVTAITHSINDEWRGDDTLRFNVFYNYPNDIRTAAITNPTANEKKDVGTVFQPTATFIPEVSNTKQFSNIPASVVIRRCFDNAVVFSADSTIPYLHTDSGAIAFRFPSQKGGITIKNLPIGCYRMSVSVNFALDSNRANDTLTQTFSIIEPGLTKNIRVDTILSPINGFVLAVDTTSVPVAVRYTNSGQSGESLVQALVFARNQEDSIIYSDVRFMALASLETRDVTFANFKPTGLGVFRVVGMSVLSGDVRKSDDSLVHKIFRGFSGDVATLAITSPMPGEEKTEGQTFTPVATFRWQGGFTGKSNIPARIDIRPCGDTTVVFHSQIVIPVLNADMGKKTHSFPSQNGSMDVRNLTPGCYRATVTVMADGDTFADNDTTSVMFTVLQGADVPLVSNAQISLDQTYPNPTKSITTFGFTLSDEGVVSMRLTDMLGVDREVLARTYYTTGRHSVALDLSDLPNGSYLYELTFTGHDGLAKRITRTLAIVR